MTRSKNDLYELTYRGFSIVGQNFDVLETRMRERLIKERVHQYDAIRLYKNGKLRCESLVRDLINQSGVW